MLATCRSLSDTLAALLLNRWPHFMNLHPAPPSDSRPRASSSRILRIGVVAALILSSTLGIRGAGHRAQLSLDLLNYEGRHDSTRARVIVRGSRLQIEAMASRHHLAIARFL